MFKVTKEVTPDQIAGLLCTGFEGGMTSCWADVVAKRKPSSLPKFKGGWEKYPTYSYPLGRGGRVTILDVETGKRHPLTLASIRRGLKVMADKYPRHLADFLNEEDDAVTGDVFIQCCVLGDVLYG